MVSEHQVQHRKITVSVSDLLVVLGCPGSGFQVQNLELFKEVGVYWSGCSALAADSLESWNQLKVNLRWRSLTVK